MPRWGRTWTELLLDICLPRACAACRRDLEPPLEGPLCGDCMAALAPIAPPLCGFCGAPLRGSADCRRACRRDLPSLDAARAAFLYKAPLRQLLHAFKYAGSARAGAALAGWLAGLAPRHPILRRAEVVVPVPLHAVKL
ncbi:MAG TPA: double zinc ribbon domain-containing protein, partial [Elusimicrobiota bacterium]|nr:double zinc ribbon domain-containing protein [Elusimicrobiota bacterium]